MEILTERLRLQPRSRDDLDACLAMDRDKDVTAYIKGPWHDPVAHRHFVLEKMAINPPLPFGYWSIFSKEDLSTFLGWVMALPKTSLPTDKKTALVELGWRLRKTVWGKGIATEAVTAIIEHIFASYPKVTLYAEIAIENNSSIKLAQKLGMERTTQRASDGDVIFRRNHHFPGHGCNLQRK